VSVFGTRRWAAIRAWVLRRDRHICQMTVDGHRCGAYADTVNHIVRREHGGTDEVSNLQAACAPCNYGEVPDGAGYVVLPRLTVKQALVVRALDEVGAPVAVGRRRAAPILVARYPDATFGTRDIDTACRYRRARGALIRL
jgi:5-methylcytosine-specific restriction endonuclease McrA